MLVHSFDRFYIVKKFILPSIGDIKFSRLNYDNTCTYMCHTGVVYDNLSIVFVHWAFSINNKVGLVSFANIN